VWIGETQRKLEAGLPRLRYLQQRRTNPQDIADADRVLVEETARIIEYAWSGDGTALRLQTGSHRVG